MSQITNVITTEYRARGSQAIASMGSIAQGFGTVGRVINDNTRLSERLNNQWRAIGTTMRYAISGTVIFGMTSMVRQLAAMNQQLGQMQAISGIGPGTPFSNRDITSLFGNLQTVAGNTITPLGDVNDAAVNFLSTVQNVKPSELPTMLQQIAQGAKLAQTPVEDLTQAATTMQIAFGRASSPTSIGQFTRMWERLIGIAPGGVSAAPSIAQAMPSLASMFQLAPGKKVPANVGQAQLMTLTLGALRTGMPASTAMRGVTYLLQSIAQPTGGARKALAGIGITPQFVQSQGIYAATMKLLNTIAPVSKQRATQLGQIPDENLDDTSNLPGIPANEMIKLRKMVPRIHGIRAAIILASQLQQQGNVASLQQDLQGMLNVQNQQSKEAKQLAQAWENFRKRSRLSDAANQINLMAIQVAQTFEPVFGFVAQHAVMPAGKAMRQHRGLTKDIVLGGAGFMAALGLARLTGVGNLPGISKIPGLSKLLGGGGLGRSFVVANAAQAAISGNAAIGASPQNPLYVIVVGEIFGGAGSMFSGPKGGKGGGTIDPTNPVNDYFGYRVARGGVKYGRKGISALSNFARRALGLADETPKFNAAWMNDAGMVGGKFLPKVGVKALGPLGALIDFFSNVPAAGGGEQAYISNLTQLRRSYGGQRVAGYEAGTAKLQMIHGKADISVVVDITQDGKVTRKRVHVPVDMWSGGRVPTSGGKAGTKRSK